MNDDIIELQTRIAFQDGVIEQLNQVVTKQQNQIDRLQR
jgi:SlyX protein